MDLAKSLGIDVDTPSQVLAGRLVDAHEHLLSELVQKRYDHNLSQSTVAERMGVTATAISKIESGERDLRQSTLRRYAHAVQAEIEYRVTNFDPPAALVYASSESRSGHSRSQLTSLLDEFDDDDFLFDDSDRIASLWERSRTNV